jgi:hypothetical protein
MLAISQQHRIKVGTHKHLPPFLLAALRQDIPVCLTIRPPADAAISWAIYTHGNLAVVLEKYIDFYTVLLPYRTRFLVLPFHLITDDCMTMLTLVSLRFGLNLTIPADTDLCAQEAFQRIDKIWSDDLGGIKEWQVARPHPSREVQKSELLRQLESPQYKLLLEEGDRLYRLFYLQFEADLEKYIHHAPKT